MPLKSCPSGGIPPALNGSIVTGGKPSVYEAFGDAVATGIEFFAPPLAKGVVRLLGRVMLMVDKMYLD